MKVGQVYKLKTTGELVLLRSVSRGICCTDRNGPAEHYVQIDYQDLQEWNLFTVRVPFKESLESDDPRIEEIVNALIAGTQVPKAGPSELSGPSEPL